VVLLALLLLWVQLVLHIRIGSLLGRLFIRNRSVRSLIRMLITALLAFVAIVAVRYLFLVPSYRFGREVEALVESLAMFPTVSPWYAVAIVGQDGSLASEALLNAGLYAAGLAVLWTALFFWAF